MVDSTQSTKDDFGAFKDSRILIGGGDFQIVNGLDNIVFQGKLEIGRNLASRNTLRDLIGVMSSILDAIPDASLEGVAPSPMKLDGIELHPTKRIGFCLLLREEFITDLPCGDDGTIQVHLASCEAIAAIESRPTSVCQESVFLVGIGEDPVITVFISEPEYEEGFLYPSE